MSIPTSGQRRINAKRRQRAAFWAAERHTVKVLCNPAVEQPFREHLHLLGDRARIDRRTPLLIATMVELDVHIPGAPLDATMADLDWGATWHGDEQRIYCSGISWYADGRLTGRWHNLFAVQAHR
jgi:hypothetical protein